MRRFMHMINVLNFENVKLDLVNLHLKYEFKKSIKMVNYKVRIRQNKSFFNSLLNFKK